MRQIAVTLLVICLFPSLAWSGICDTVEWRSLNRIACRKVRTPEGRQYVLKYTAGTFAIVEGMGQRSDLIRALCRAGGLQVREVDGATSYVHLCSTFGK
jgi:hypothetical protein